jgi:hypothetical protein
MMRIFAPDNSELMQISSITRDGNLLVLKGKVFGTLPMTARVKPGEARRGLRLLNLGTLLFLLTFVFRRDK